MAEAGTFELVFYVGMRGREPREVGTLHVPVKVLVEDAQSRRFEQALVVGLEMGLGFVEAQLAKDAEGKTDG